MYRIEDYQHPFYFPENRIARKTARRAMKDAIGILAAHGVTVEDVQAANTLRNAALYLIQECKKLPLLYGGE